MAVVTVTVMATVTAVCILVTVEDALRPVLLSGPRCGRQLCGLSLQAAPAAFARGADRLRVTGRTRPGLPLPVLRSELALCAGNGSRSLCARGIRSARSARKWVKPRTGCRPGSLGRGGDIACRGPHGTVSGSRALAVSEAPLTQRQAVVEQKDPNSSFSFSFIFFFVPEKAPTTRGGGMALYSNEVHFAELIWRHSRDLQRALRPVTPHSPRYAKWEL